MHAIEIENLSVDYRVGFLGRRTVRALDGLTLQVARGEIFSFLGPNGAGKTTTFKLLLRLLYPTTGTARILDCPLDDLAMRARIGYLPEQPYFYDYLTARELLVYCGKLFALPKAEALARAQRLLVQVGLAAEADKHLRKFSKGMLQRIGLAQSLINDPDVLFLDEPMSGLDPLGRREVRELMQAQRAAGKTVFFSSHVLNDVEALCDRVAILKQGRLIETGKLSTILQRTTQEIDVVVQGASVAALQPIAVSVAATPEGARVRLRGEQELEKLLGVLRPLGGQVVSVSPVRESLEDLFLREVSRDS
jgi:ABC-2 type transport system ATP-binding protein